MAYWAMIRVLLQTTIPTTADDWSIARFSRLAAYLRQERSEKGPLFDVSTRDRDPLGASDSVLSTLDKSSFDEVWLFAVDTGNGLTSWAARSPKALFTILPTTTGM